MLYLALVCCEHPKVEVNPAGRTSMLEVSGSDVFYSAIFVFSYSK